MSSVEIPQSTAKSTMKSGVIAGIHLAGPNARKSAVVLLEFTDQYAAFLSLYEKIGSSGSLFSDERILNILKVETKLVDVMVDCPVTEPPCVSCVRPTCPGVVRCDDVSVAMMMAIEHQRGRKGAHKLRPLNPQNQRLWDVMFARGGAWGNLEPSYSANLAPLVVRAKTLQRRLRSVYTTLELKETNVPILLAQLGLLFDGNDWGTRYRSFEAGSKTRSEILKAIVQGPFPELRIQVAKDAIREIVGSVETFHAFMAAAMGLWGRRGISQSPTPFFEQHPGWVEMIQSESLVRE